MEHETAIGCFLRSKRVWRWMEWFDGEYYYESFESPYNGAVGWNPNRRTG